MQPHQILNEITVRAIDLAQLAQPLKLIGPTDLALFLQHRAAGLHGVEPHGQLQMLRQLTLKLGLFLQLDEQLIESLQPVGEFIERATRQSNSTIGSQLADQQLPGCKANTRRDVLQPSAFNPRGGETL